MLRLAVWFALALIGVALALYLYSAYGDTASLSETAGYGADPTLPAPEQSWPIPTLNPAKAIGWPEDAAPTAVAGFSVTRFAEGLDHPRWLYLLPNGDVLVAESSGPIREAKGFTDWVAGQMRSRAGADTPSANRITLLRDANGDGTPETKNVFLSGLNSPHGMALVGGFFYVANTDAILRYPYTLGETSITARAEHFVDLPHEPPNSHWTRNVLASADGTKLYATVGSNSNIAEGGIEREARRANVLEITIADRKERVYASGLRNPLGLAWEPTTNVLWTTVNERDMLGHDLVPDYMTGLKDGAFYGWPFSYFGQNVDPRVKPPRADLVAAAIKPDFALGAHTASLGLIFYSGDTFTAHYRGGAFVAQHGSWNRNPRSGYKVVYVPFASGRPAGTAEDFLTGFLDADGEAQGRPVGLTLDRTGALLVADDVGNIVWRVAPTKAVQ